MPTKAQLEKQLSALQAENDELKSRAVDPMAHYSIGNHYDDDQLEARTEATRKKGLEGHGVSVGLEPTDKDFLRRGDEFAEGRQPWEVLNPRQDLMDKHVPKGHRGRFLSPRHIDHLGMRGWEPVQTDDGRQVKHAGQILASMPESKAKQRQEFFRDKTRSRTREIQSHYREETKSRDMYVKGEDQVQISRRVTREVPA